MLNRGKKRENVTKITVLSKNELIFNEIVNFAQQQFLIALCDKHVKYVLSQVFFLSS